VSISSSLHVTPEPNASTPFSSGSVEPEILQRERTILRELLSLVAERSQAETKVEHDRTSRNAKADSEYQKARALLVEKTDRLDRAARTDDERRRKAIVDTALDGEAKAKTEFASASRKLATDFDLIREHAKNEHKRARDDATSTFDNDQRKALKDHADARKPIDEWAKSAESFRQRLAALATEYRKFHLNPDAPKPTRENYARFEDPLPELLVRITRMGPQLKLLEELIIPKMMKGRNEAWVFVVVVLIMLGLGMALGGGPIVLGAMAASGVALALLLRTSLIQLSKKQLNELYKPLMQSLVDADGLIAHSRTLVDARREEAIRKLITQREESFNRAKDIQAKTIASGENNRDDRLRKINEVYSWRITEVQTTQQRDLRAALDTHDRRMAELKAQSEANFQKLEERYKELKEEIQNRYEIAWNALAQRWREGIRRVSAELEAIEREVDSYGPGWDDPSWNDRPWPRQIPPVLRLGTVPLELAALPRGIASDARLMEGIPTRFSFPALRPFPGAANLLIEAPPEGRTAALAALQASMLRLLTSLPPGRVQFTIVDPVGIGRGFGAFLHLADFDGALVSQQVWTDHRQIEERLAELGAHMEKVTQKYLRNEYATIEEYNAVAGEVAEPYRVLVIADFPTQFEEKSAARLAAIVAGGVPCGILTMIAADSSRPLPEGCRIEDLRSSCVSLTWNGERLAWDDPDFSPYPLILDPPPPAEFATRQIQKIGAAAKDAKRVEVPFEFIAPPDDAWWTRDSRSDIDIPLGKAGATKRQHLTLGHGTAQHVLIAGRTGSGKSTLMHALITNLALNYSPDEIDLYLIDFKKGVEFKVYATHELPHASVVAIESEREFGLSVLQRLDAELRLRADRFREAGVQDIQGYRNVPGAPPLPRILLIVDEFQEFFVEEDKLAQEAALWLDRLVRQGRAFGMHVHLGSQSLGGAFTLARSTLGQMAVRIALQCSEADSHLILSETNPAARMLSRPGEAIYNDANGATEGNHFFQVVWLSEERREEYLKRLRQLADVRKPVLSRTPIVFEGEAPADLARNPLLRRQLDAPAWPESPVVAHAWLGDAVAIKDPTSALFRRQGGSHLLIVGQNDEAALGIAIATLLSLAVQYPPSASNAIRSGARFFLLDGTPEDHPQAGVLERVASMLPHGATVGGGRDVARILAEVAAEITRRQEADTNGPEVFLFIHDLPRFRSLRRREDDFSFSRREEDATPPDHLETILREGPSLGIHVITWCDTLNSLNRHFAPQLLREFELRVLFQMSPADSGYLLDSPLASKLGPHRALFSSEEQNRVEKFRPYGIPPDEWLAQVRDRLASRGASTGTP
jgi:hypothetical protein